MSVLRNPVGEEEGGEPMGNAETSEFQGTVSPGSFFSLEVLGKYSALEGRALPHLEHTATVASFPRMKVAGDS